MVLPKIGSGIVKRPATVVRGAPFVASRPRSYTTSVDEHGSFGRTVWKKSPVSGTSFNRECKLSRVA